jgi:hypothetical protein
LGLRQISGSLSGRRARGKEEKRGEGERQRSLTSFLQSTYYAGLF